VVDAARMIGLVATRVPTDYERWVERVEPHLWSRPVWSRPVRSHLVDPQLTGGFLPVFMVDVVVGSHTSPVDVTATTLSLVDQSWPTWSARLVLDSQVQTKTQDACQRAANSDPRITVSLTQPEVLGECWQTDIEAGAIFANHAFNELVVTLQEDALKSQRTYEAVVADSDSWVSASGRREFPILLPDLHPDLVDQYDLTSAFVSRRHGSTASLGLLICQGRVARCDRVLLHRARTQPPLSSLTPAVPGGDLRFGTRIHHPANAVTAHLVIRDPLSGRAADKHRAALVKATGVLVTVASVSTVVSVDGALRIPPTIFSGANVGAEVVVVVDGSVLPSQIGWLDDLVGALLRDHVFSVAPLIVSPSGVAFDGGIDAVDQSSTGETSTPTLVVRSGRVDLPPFDLCRVTPTDTLSCRSLVIRSSDLAQIESLSPRSLYEASTQAGRVNLVWAHQCWGIDASLGDVSALTPGMSAWQSGRLGSWCGTDVEPHHPTIGRKGEGVW
jgi:hypothetical protein